MTFESLKQMKRMKIKFRGSASLILLLGTLAIFLLANFLSPYGPNDIGVGDHFAPPSGAHLFGTDNLGRDLLSRILFGGRITVLIALGATSIALILGSAWGILAGIRGGWIDEFLMRTADALMAVPLILFALFCISALGSSIASLILVAGILLSPSTARMARSAVKAELASPYVVSAVAFGVFPVNLRPRGVCAGTAPLAALAALAYFMGHARKNSRELERRLLELEQEEDHVFDFLHGIGAAFSEGVRSSELHRLLVESAVRIMDGAAGAQRRRDRHGLDEVLVEHSESRDVTAGLNI